ncbi:MAG: CoA transferase [Rhodospirillaceae bacterium]|nr:CoA transferase [Rhodospirillaceae bacterium]
MKQKKTGPLSGVRVLSIGSSIVGPWAATLLGYLGADVVKIERPTGEYLRLLYPLQNGMSTTYTSTNINQRIAELDVKQPEDLATVHRLADQADILIENFRPGVGDRIGLGYDQLHKRNPRLVYGSSTGWGGVGPMRDLAALDPHLQAFTGIASLNGVPGGAPEMLRFVHMDPSAATSFAGLTLLGLIERERFGHACLVQTSHLAMGVAQQMSRVAEGLLSDVSLELLGSASSVSAPNQCFETLDSTFLAVTCDNQEQWEGLCRAVEQVELIQDKRFATNIDRVNNRGTLAELVGGILKTKPARWWVIRFQREGVPHGFSLDFESIKYHQQIVENDFLTTVNPPPDDSMYVGGVPWAFSRTPAQIDAAVPVPGQHTREVVADGFSENLKTDKEETTDADVALPLSGLRVVDATQGFAGPYLGLLLAEAGAEVIKVEPPRGDWARQLAPQTSSGNSAVFDSFNRNKDSIALDLDTAAGKVEYKALVQDAAVVLEDWGVGIAASRELSCEKLSKDNPGLVYLALTPFGEKGPMKHLPGSELVVQAMTGYLRLLGKLGEAPVRAGADIVATCAGSMAFVGVLSALYHRERTGQGQRIAISLLGSMMCMRTHQWAARTNPDKWLGDSYCSNEEDNPHYGYQTKDKPIFMTPATGLSHEDFLSLLEAFQMKEAFEENPNFAENWWHTLGLGYLSGAAKPLWDEYVSKFSSQEALDIVEQYDIWAVEFSDLTELMDHPQVKALDLVQSLDGKKYVRAPWITPWGLPDLKMAPEI